MGVEAHVKDMLVFNIYIYMLGCSFEYVNSLTQFNMLLPLYYFGSVNANSRLPIYQSGVVYLLRITWKQNGRICPISVLILLLIFLVLLFFSCN